MVLGMEQQLYTGSRVSAPKLRAADFSALKGAALN